MILQWSGSITAAVAEFAGTGTTGVKQCIKYEILEASRSIHPSKLENLHEKRKRTGKPANLPEKVILCHGPLQRGRFGRSA